MTEKRRLVAVTYLTIDTVKEMAERRSVYDMVVNDMKRVTELKLKHLVKEFTGKEVAKT